MGTILEDVFLGTAEKYNQKLEMLARMAQPEKWTYKRIQDKDPYRILRNYIQYTYNRLDEEGKIISSADGKYRCMNTGLLTVYNQEIAAIFAVNEMSGKQPWFFNGFFKETDKFFTTNFSELPPLADYCNNVKDLIYDNMVLCQEKVQIKSNQFSLCLAKLNLLFLSHYLLDFSDILPHIGLGINTRNGCEYVLYCKMFLCIQKSTYMHVYN